MRPSKRPTNQHLISFNEKVFKGHSKRPKIQVRIYHLQNGFFWKFLHFWNPQVWVSYWNFSIKVVGSLLFLAFMLWWAQCIFDWLGFIASAEARLRLDQKFLVWYYEARLGECPREFWWQSSQKWESSYLLHGTLHSNSPPCNNFALKMNK